MQLAEARKQIEKDVLADMKRLHETNPKYVYSTENDADFIKKHSVEQVDLKATYTKDPTGQRAIILDNNGRCTVDDFVSDLYRAQGYEVMHLESVPFHVLFGVFMWLVIQDPTDPLIRIEGFGDRKAFEERQPSEIVWFHRSPDFGTKGYATRRAKEINEHLSPFWIEDGVMQGLFDYWLGPSEKLRQYLWAHRDTDVQRARLVIDIIPPSSIVNILRYLIADYWHHYLGWPDLLVYRRNEFFLAEVKASGDKLSDEQKVWIEGNQRELRLPFKLVKVHKLGIAAIRPDAVAR